MTLNSQSNTLICHCKSFFVIIFLLFSLSAKASLIGDSIIGCFAPLDLEGNSLCQQNIRNNLFDNGIAIVREELIGQEFSGSIASSQHFIADVDSESIMVAIGSIVGSSFFSGAAAEFFFDDLDWIEEPGKITGVTVKTEDNMDLALNQFINVTFTEDSISIKLDADIPMIRQIRAATLEIQTEHLPPIDVSEPSILFAFSISTFWFLYSPKKIDT